MCPSRFNLFILALVWIGNPSVGQAGLAIATALDKVEATRAEALGGAATALGLDHTLVWLNPAALAQISDSALTLSGQRGFFEEFTGQGLWAFPAANGALAVGALYYTSGSMTLNASDGTTRTLNAQQDLMVLIGYARSLLFRMVGGITVKGLRSELFEEASASAVAIDAGVQYRLNRIVKIGVVAQNLGTNLKYIEQTFDLPVVVRGGVVMGRRVGGRASHGSLFEGMLLAVVDAEYMFGDSLRTWRGGLEYLWHGMIAIRAGARLPSKEQLGGFSGGLGLKAGRYRLDYSLQFENTFGVPQTVSLTVLW